MNTQKSAAAYAIGIGLLMMLSIIASNVPQLSLSAYVQVPFRLEISVALFLVGAATGMLALLRSVARGKTPWKVPQAQVSLPYLVFFLATLLAIALSH